MDIQMPVMDGYEATKHIRKLEETLGINKTKRAFILGLSAHSTDQFKIKCFESGMDEFSKTFLILTQK